MAPMAYRLTMRATEDHLHPSLCGLQIWRHRVPRIGLQTMAQGILLPRFRDQAIPPARPMLRPSVAPPTEDREAAIITHTTPTSPSPRGTIFTWVCGPKPRLPPDLPSMA